MLSILNILGYAKLIMTLDCEWLDPPWQLLISNIVWVCLYIIYSPWIASFFDKIYLLTQIISFPLTHPVIKAFEDLKMDITNSAIIAVNPAIPLVVETHTLNCAIDAVTKTIWSLCSILFLWLEQQHSTKKKEPLWRT